MDNKKSSKGIITTIVIVVMLLIIMALVAFIAYLLGNGALRDSEGDKTQTEGSVEAPESEAVEETQTTDAVTDADTQAMIETVMAADTRKRPPEWYGNLDDSGSPDRYIDFEKLRKQCPDIYAWIEIPGTDIDYPIAYCEDSVDPYWYTHDIDGNPDKAGMIITDSMNRNDFSDPETLIYGQAPDDGTMFAQLSKFKDPEFFKTHDRIIIHMPDAQLIYKVYACYTGSSDHILINNDFNDPIQFMKFFDSIGEIRDLSMNIREDAKPMLGDHAIALVTHCSDETKRLFVHAVLADVKY